MTLEYIQALEANTDLEQEIKEIIINNIEDYENPKNFFTDLAQYGCVSGMVSEFVWYSDTVSFCKRHKEDINEAISEIMDCYGVTSLAELLGNRFDNTDFLCIGDQNQNLITWFIFEETCASVLRTFENEIELEVA